MPGSAEPRILLLKRTSEYLERLSRADAQDEGVILDVGEAYLRLGTLQSNAFESSVGDVKAAEGSYLRAIELEDRLLDRKPEHRQALDIGARARLQLSSILSSMAGSERRSLRQRRLRKHSRALARAIRKTRVRYGTRRWHTSISQVLRVRRTS